MYFDVPGLIKSIDTSDFKDLTSQVIGDVLLNVHSLSKFGFLGEFVLMKIDFAVKGQIVTFFETLAFEYCTRNFFIENFFES